MTTDLGAVLESAQEQAIYERVDSHVYQTRTTSESGAPMILYGFSSKEPRHIDPVHTLVVRFEAQTGRIKL